MRDSAYGLVLLVDLLMNTPVKSLQNDHTAPQSLTKSFLLLIPHTYVTIAESVHQDQMRPHKADLRR
jgi:hypothetical protein